MKIFVSLTASLCLILGAIMFARSGNEGPSRFQEAVIKDGIQTIEIEAKGGYSPNKIAAKAGIPTIIRFSTQATFDCSAAVVIPELGVSKILPQTGVTDIELGMRESGVLYGSCGMGMYPFEIEFVE